MSNLYVNLPVPVGNGAGTAVDVSTLGAMKTVVATGNSQAQLNIEINNDPAQAGGWQSLTTIANAGFQIFYAACMWMRVRVSNYNINVGGTSSVNVGGTDDGATFVALPTTVGNGAGAAVDVSAQVGTYKSVQVAGPFQGTTIVEVSVDGSTEWAQPFSFGTPGVQSLVIVAKFMRVRRVGVPVINPGLPIINVGFSFMNTGGGGGGGALPPDGNYGDVTVSGAGSIWDVNALPESRITNLVADLAALAAGIASRVPLTRAVNATAPLTVNGGASATLAADVTLAINTSGLVPGTRTLTTTAPLTIDGGASADLSANRTIAINTGGLVPSTRTMTGTTPIQINGSNAAQDLSANQTYSILPFTTLLAGVANASGNAANVLRGDNTWSTIVQLTAALNQFTTLLQGVTSASGSAANFLRGDNTWSTVAQVTAGLNQFTTVLQGMASASSAAANFLRGDNTWSTIVQVTAAMNLFTTALQGMVPASSAAANFLRGDATWNTPTQVTAALNAFTTALQGMVPASGAASSFLRGDGSWNTPTQVTAALNAFTTALQGMVPASSAAANFLRGDGTWSTIAQVTAALNVFTSVLQGLVPASGGGTTTFLRADGTWSAVSVPAFDTILTPAQITFGPTFDNWNPGVFGQNTLVRCTTDGSTRNVRGMVGGVNGITVTLMNVNASSSVGESWQAEDPAATAANRFRTAFLSGGCTYYYDGTLARWVLITGSP